MFYTRFRWTKTGDTVSLTVGTINQCKYSFYQIICDQVYFYISY